MTNGHRGIEVFTRRSARRSASPTPRRRSAPLGLISLLAALATVILLWMGMSFAVGGRNLVSTDLAYLAIGMSVVAIVGGLSAIVLGRGRALGVVAIVVGLLANPLLLTRLLSWAGGLG